MGETRQTFTTEIAAPVERCFDVIVDFAAYPTWSSVITACSVREFDEQGVGRIVQFELDMKLKTIRYVLAYSYERPTRLEWKLVEGDVSAVEGSYLFEPVAGGTRTTCSQAVDLGFWVPGPIRRVAEQKALKDSVLEFKAAVEKRR